VLSNSQPFWCSPRTFLANINRRGIQYDDPFPGLQHRYIEANGIRQAHGSAQIPYAAKTLLTMVCECHVVQVVPLKVMSGEIPSAFILTVAAVQVSNHMFMHLLHAYCEEDICCCLDLGSTQ